MIKSIQYFEEKSIKKFEKLEDNFLKNPKDFASYVVGLTEELHNLGLRMIQESLETMNQLLRDSRPAQYQTANHFAGNSNIYKNVI